MKAYPITVLCAVMEISRSGFYDYLHRLNTDNPNDEHQNALKARIKEIFNESKGSCGSRRVLKKLPSEGHQLGRCKVRRLMRDLGLRAKRRRRYKVTTDSHHHRWLGHGQAHEKQADSRCPGDGLMAKKTTERTASPFGSRQPACMP